MDYRCPKCFESLRFKSLAQGDWLAGINATPYVCPFCETSIVYARSPIPEIFRGRAGARLYKLIIALSVASALAIGINTKHWFSYVAFGAGFGLSVIISIEGYMSFIFRRVPRYTIASPFTIPTENEQPRKYLSAPSDITDLKSGDVFEVIKPFSDGENCVAAIGDKLTYQRQAFDNADVWMVIFAEKKLRLNEERDEYFLHNVDEYLRIVQSAPCTINTKTGFAQNETPMRRNAVYLMALGLVLSSFSFITPHTSLDVRTFMGVTTMAIGLFFLFL